jgi:replicative DNA helicase
MLTSNNYVKYITEHKFNFRLSNNEIILEVCPACGKDNFHFYMSNSTGLWDCKHCGQSGNFFQFCKVIGEDVDSQFISLKDSQTQKNQLQPLPDPEILHRLLKQDRDTLAMVLSDRCWSEETVDKLQLGLELFGGIKWLVFPYFHNRVPVYMKWRSLPPAEKTFRSPLHYEARLYNEDCLTVGMESLLLAEGETDCVSAINVGVTNVVGIPGANIKKALWIDNIKAANPTNIFICYDLDQTGQNAARDMASRIGVDKVKNVILPEFTTPEGKKGKDICDYFRSGHSLEDFNRLLEHARPFHVAGVVTIQDTIDELIQDITTRGHLKPTLSTPWPTINRLVGGFEYGDLVSVLASAKTGKAQPLFCNIKTSNGWKLMGELQIGDELASVDGQPSKVLGIFPQGEEEIFKVTFSDERFTHCSKNHLWNIRNLSNKNCIGDNILSTEQLIKVIPPRRRQELYIPLFSGEYGSEISLPIDPWLLGALLGDGSLTKGTVAIHKQDEEIYEKTMSIVEPLGCILSKISSGFRIVKKQKDNKPTIIVEKLKELQLLGTHSHTKFIPEIYIKGSRKQRVALLQGLLDTDGTVEKKGTVYVSTSSPKMAEQIQYLIRSIGGISNIQPHNPTYWYKGERRKGLTNYRVQVKMSDREELFSLTRKRNRAIGIAKLKLNRLTIKSIEPAGKAETQCIAVSHPSQLYITDDFIVTHNTSFALNWLDYYSSLGIPSLMYCCEMPPKRLIRKWISYVTDTPDSPLESQITLHTIQSAKEIANNRTGDYLFGFTKINKVNDVFQTITDAVSRYGVKIVCFDNLQLLVRSIDNYAQETSVLTKKFKELAMALNILIVLIVQPTKIKEGEVISETNARGSAAIQQDVDAMLVLHRNKKANFTEQDLRNLGHIEIVENLEPKMFVRASLTRYAPGGIGMLYMDGEKSSITEMPQVNPGGSLSSIKVEEVSTETPFNL